MKILVKSVNSTPAGMDVKTKWTEYQVNGVMIAEAHVFPMYGKFHKPGTLGRSFYWNLSNLEAMFGPEKIQANADLLKIGNQDLVYGRGRTVPFKRVKEVINQLTNS